MWTWYKCKFERITLTCQSEPVRVYPTHMSPHVSTPINVSWNMPPLVRKATAVTLPCGFGSLVWAPRREEKQKKKRVKLGFQGMGKLTKLAILYTISTSCHVRKVPHHQEWWSSQAVTFVELSMARLVILAIGHHSTLKLKFGIGIGTGIWSWSYNNTEGGAAWYRILQSQRSQSRVVVEISLQRSTSDHHNPWCASLPSRHEATNLYLQVRFCFLRIDWMWSEQ